MFQDFQASVLKSDHLLSPLDLQIDLGLLLLDLGVKLIDLGLHHLLFCLDLGVKQINLGLLLMIFICNFVPLLTDGQSSRHLNYGAHLPPFTYASLQIYA